MLLVPHAPHPLRVKHLSAWEFEKWHSQATRANPSRLQGESSDLALEDAYSQGQIPRTKPASLCQGYQLETLWLRGKLFRHVKRLRRRQRAKQHGRETGANWAWHRCLQRVAAAQHGLNLGWWGLRLLRSLHDDASQSSWRYRELPQAAKLAHLCRGSNCLKKGKQSKVPTCLINEEWCLKTHLP